MADVVRWGVLSTADIAVRKVIPALQKARRSTVVAIGSRDIARANEAARALGIEHAYGSYGEVLSDADVDAVYVPLPNHLHMEWTLRAAEAGKHVLCEKPLALTSADASQMVAGCAAAGVMLLEAFMYRLHPSWVAVRQLVQSGQIGKLTAIQSWFSYFNDDPCDIRNVRGYGGGALYDIGCYCVNLSRMIFGEEPTGVHSSVVRDSVLGVDIRTSAILEFGDRTSAFTCSTRATADQRVHVYGTAGRIFVPIPFNIPPDRSTTIQLSTRDVHWAPETIEFPATNQYVVQTEAFVAAVLDGAELPFPSSDAIANLRVIEQIFDASA